MTARIAKIAAVFAMAATASFGEIDVSKYGYSAKENLRLCTDIAIDMGEKPDLVCPIMMNETDAEFRDEKLVGDTKFKPLKRSYGLMQVRLGTARLVFRRYGLDGLDRLPDETVVAKLIYDREFNIRTAILYLKYIKERWNFREKRDWKYAVVYNSGKFDPKNLKYKEKFLKNRKIYNREYAEAFGKAVRTASSGRADDGIVVSNPSLVIVNPEG